MRRVPDVTIASLSAHVHPGGSRECPIGKSLSASPSLMDTASPRMLAEPYGRGRDGEI